jgi:hypothetical protein
MKLAVRMKRALPSIGDPNAVLVEFTWDDMFRHKGDCVSLSLLIDTIGAFCPSA